MSFGIVGSPLFLKYESVFVALRILKGQLDLLIGLSNIRTTFMRQLSLVYGLDVDVNFALGSLPEFILRAWFTILAFARQIRKLYSSVSIRR
jgi:hypothetical protein